MTIHDGLWATLWLPSEASPSLRSGHITDAYLVSCLRHFTQIRPIGQTSDMRQTLGMINFKNL
jgi:hypothetical protein